MIDEAVANVLREYDARAKDEAKVVRDLPVEDVRRRRDEFLLPIGPEVGSFLNALARGSHAKMILWDHSAGQFEGCVGSCNWLSFASSASGTNTVTEVSVKLSRPGLLARLS